MSFQTTNNNTFNTAPTFPNPYMSRKLNNMDQVQVMKREREDWSRIYHKTLKGIEAMCYGSKLKGLSNETTLVLSNTRELDRVPNTK